MTISPMRNISDNITLSLIYEFKCDIIIQNPLIWHVLYNWSRLEPFRFVFNPPVKLFHGIGVRRADKRSHPTNGDTGDVWHRRTPSWTAPPASNVDVTAPVGGAGHKNVYCCSTVGENNKPKPA